MLQLAVQTTSRQVMAWGLFLTPPADPALTVVTVAPNAEAAALAQLTQAGIKTVAADGTITVTPPDPALLVTPNPTPKRAAAVTALKAAAGGAGAVATLAQSILDLNGIT